MIDVLRRNRTLVLILGSLLLLLVALTVLNRDTAYPDADLHPENPDPNGARAVARVLSHEGIDVVIAHNQQELLAARTDRDTTVMVTSVTSLGPSTARTLFRTTAGAGGVVLAAPPPQLVTQVAPGLVDGPTIGGQQSPRCDDALLRDLDLDVRRSPGYRLDGATACYPEGGYALVVRVDPLRADLPTTYVVGGADLFSNHSVLDADNAAAALRLLGQHGRLVWYVPDPADLAPGEGASISDLLPRWLNPALILVGATMVAVVLWRGRRLGPVVVEPLPVVVRSREAVEARGRLYRRAGDRAHTAQALRNGTVDRLLEHLALPPDAPRELLVSEVARVTSRQSADVSGLLLHSPVRDDAALVALAADLSTLESEVGDV